MKFHMAEFYQTRTGYRKGRPCSGTAIQLTVISYFGFAVSYTLSDSTLEIQHIAQYVMSLLRMPINDPDKG